jgi:hypothetical protein
VPKSFFRIASLAAILISSTLFTIVLPSAAQAGGSSIGNGGHQMCAEGAIQVFMESDEQGNLANRVTLTCHNGQFSNQAYHPTKIVHMGCKEGQKEFWNDGPSDSGDGGFHLYVCHNGVFKKN